MIKEPLPTISVITAAYNRSNVLKYAISSVVWQTFNDWELIVVDDASTDDTEAVVHSFNDQRIRYIKFITNIGEQSGPNNEGLRHARGRYIAYINQDDLWFPDHLATLLQLIRSTGADWVCALGIAPLENGHIELCGVMPENVYDPKYARPICASLWLLKKDVLEESGGWHFYRTLYISPSQDLLIRAQKDGKRILVSSCVTVVIIPSGARYLSYSNRIFKENKFYFESILSNCNFRNEQIFALSLQSEKKKIVNSLNLSYAFRNLLTTCVKRVGLLFGIMPVYIYFLLRYRGKGAFVEWLRKKRGLPRLK